MTNYTRKNGKELYFTREDSKNVITRPFVQKIRKYFIDYKADNNPNMIVVYTGIIYDKDFDKWLMVYGDYTGYTNISKKLLPKYDDTSEHYNDTNVTEYLTDVELKNICLEKDNKGKYLLLEDIRERVYKEINKRIKQVKHESMKKETLKQKVPIKELPTKILRQTKDKDEENFETFEEKLYCGLELVNYAEYMDGYIVPKKIFRKERVYEEPYEVSYRRYMGGILFSFYPQEAKGKRVKRHSRIEKLMDTIPNYPIRNSLKDLINMGIKEVSKNNYEMYVAVREPKDNRESLEKDYNDFLKELNTIIKDVLRGDYSK